jgi:sec-independent protein translocase protein TatA
MASTPDETCCRGSDMPFNLGPGELLLILLLALIVLGPGKLPEVGSALGRAIREFRQAASDVTSAASSEPAGQTAAPGAGSGASAGGAAPSRPEESASSTTERTGSSGS